MSTSRTLVRHSTCARASSQRASGARGGVHGGEVFSAPAAACTSLCRTLLSIATAGAFLFTVLVTPVAVCAENAPVRPSAASTGAVVIPAGVYRPLLRSTSDPAEINVAAFELDVAPVTNAQFLAFVIANPKWQRSRVTRLFADEHYLSHWAGDTELGPSAPADAPVVRVSWFSARAYARWSGKRLPTTAEWELAAAAGYDSPDGKNDAQLNSDLYRWLARPTPEVLPSVDSAKANLHGARGLHGLVWEWVADFDTAMVTGESRADRGLDRNLFCGSGAAGATDTSDYAAFMRQALRSSLKANNTTSSLGFRCARSLPVTSTPDAS